MVVAGGLTAIVLTGLSTRVAIPAYRAYAVRAQITEGLELATPYKAAVVAAWESSGHDFKGIHSRSIGTELAKHGTFVEAVDIVSGAIVITYGASADPALQKRTLTIVPALDAMAQLVEWQCGRGPAPDGFESIFEAPSRLTDVPDEYLPSGCRGR
jgi:type IV pilus assembly protein PilA